jgi:hypothetical protein
MAGKPLGGITGVLQDLISLTGPAPQAPYENVPARRPCPSDAPPVQIRSSDRSIAVIGARRGRPPRESRIAQRAKEKVTVRVDANLIAEYRDWSWESRCHLSELVGRALAEFRRRFRSSSRASKSHATTTGE